MTIRLRLAAGLTAVAAAALAGCGSSTPATGSASATATAAASSSVPSTTPSSSASSSSSSSSSSPASSSSSSASSSSTSASSAASSSTGGSTAPAGDRTAPGTELTYGQSATVPFDEDKPNELMQLTVSKPRQGTAEELAQLKVDGLKGDEAIYYLDVDLTNVSTAADGGEYTPSTSLQLLALQPNGDPAQPVIKFSAFAPCENELPSTLAVGESFKNCEIVLTSAGAPIDFVRFTVGFHDQPILWR